MYSVIDLTGRRPRRIPPYLQPPPPVVPESGVIDLTSTPRTLRASDIPPPYGPRPPSAKLGGHRFTGSLARDILAGRGPPPVPSPLRALTPLPAVKQAAPARPPAAKKGGGGYLARGGGKPRKLTKNQLHGRGEGYVYKRRDARKRYFDSAGSYSLRRKRSSKVTKPKTETKTKTKAGNRTKTRSRGGSRKRGRVGADRERTTRDLLRIASALRRSSEKRLRKISASLRDHRENIAAPPG